MAAEEGELSSVVVASIGAGKEEFGTGLDGEVEFGCELEMNELVGVEIPEEEVEFAKGGVNVALDLEIPSEKLPTGGVFDENGEGIFVEMTEFLLQIEESEFAGKGELLVRKRAGFGKIPEEERSGNEALKKGHCGRRKRHWNELIGWNPRIESKIFEG